MRSTWQMIGGWAVALLMLAPSAQAGTAMTIYDFESGLQEWSIPDWAKEKAVMELLATEDNKLDAVVQCGTNMSFMDVAEKLEPVVEIPILGINAVTFWYALRENGFEGALVGAGRLLREF